MHTLACLALVVADARLVTLLLLALPGSLFGTRVLFRFVGGGCGLLLLLLLVFRVLQGGVQCSGVHHLLPFSLLSFHFSAEVQVPLVPDVVADYVSVVRLIAVAFALWLVRWGCLTRRHRTIGDSYLLHPISRRQRSHSRWLPDHLSDCILRSRPSYVIVFPRQFSPRVEVVAVRVDSWWGSMLTEFPSSLVIEESGEFLTECDASVVRVWIDYEPDVDSAVDDLYSTLQFPDLVDPFVRLTDVLCWCYDS